MGSALIASLACAAGCSRDEKAPETATPTPATATPPATVTGAPPPAPATSASAATSAAPAKTTHKTCASGQALAKIVDAEECLLRCTKQADCPNKTFCTSGILVDPPGEHAKLCFKVD